ncbi:MAG: hypothetical protein R6X25_04115 [Candidatus Krumholzibacteriia bacterium]
MTSYQGSAAIAGDGGKALAVAVTAFTQAGFRVVHEEPRSLRFLGPRMLDKRKTPLNGARRVEVTVKGGQVHVQADLQGVGWLFSTVAAVLILVGVALATAMMLSDVPNANPLVFVLPLGVWVALMPIMYIWTRGVVVRAFDNLLQEMAAAEQRA